VVPYVVDDAPTMRHLVDLGVDGLITNYPDRLRDVLAAAGRGLPPAHPD
jgi:glycerophosphoryl diester phosphodiesterase